ncbi:MAG: 4'-phosphopantetheinyl transferase family protein [Arenimonas sp.]
MKTMLQIMHMNDLPMELDRNCTDWLTDDELARYSAISSQNRRLQYIAGHHLARAMAARFHRNAIEDWIYFVDDDNQRRLKCRQPGMQGFHVSLSHSGVWIVAALSGSPIGIDIETYERQRDFLAIASHVFSEAESSLLRSLAPPELKRQFYLYWTMKECVAKQYGAGLKFEVARAHSFIPAITEMDASVCSWECSEYVIAMTAAWNGEIDITGLCKDFKKLYWQNVAVNR